MVDSGQKQYVQLIEQVTQRIDRWQLSLPALMLLHIARPFSFFAAQGLLLCEPLVGAFGRDTTLADYAELLADRDRLDHLMSHLENASRRGERSAKEND